MVDFKSITFEQVVKFFREEKGINISEKQLNLLNSIFSKSDVEDKNGHFRFGGDGTLNEAEFNDFISQVGEKDFNLSLVMNDITKSRKSFGLTGSEEKNDTTTKSTKYLKTQQTYAEYSVERDSKAEENPNSESNVKAQIEKSIRLEAARVIPAARKGEKPRGAIDINNVDIPYWVDIIYRNSKKYNISPDVLTSFIREETDFKKHVNNRSGSGPIQITTIAVADFFPGAKGNWAKFYEKLDPTLFNDVMKSIKQKGYKTPAEVRNGCAKDDDFGVKVGILCLKMNYAKSIDARINGRCSYSTIGKTIDKILTGKIKFTMEDMKKAARRYNGSNIKDSYSKNIVDTLQVAHNYDFSKGITTKNNA